MEPQRPSPHHPTPPLKPRLTRCLHQTHRWHLYRLPLCACCAWRQRGQAAVRPGPSWGAPASQTRHGGLPPKSDNNPPPQDRWRLPSSSSTPKGLRAWRPLTLPPHCGAPGLQLHAHKHNVTVVRSPGHCARGSPRKPLPLTLITNPPAPQILPRRAPGQRNPASPLCRARDPLGHPRPRDPPPRHTGPPRTRRRAGGVANDARSQRARN